MWESAAGYKERNLGADTHQPQPLLDWGTLIADYRWKMHWSLSKVEVSFQVLRRQLRDIITAFIHGIFIKELRMIVMCRVCIDILIY